jgi:hypothetical protein
MVDVLLVNPYVLTRHEPRRASYRPYPPLGLMYLGAVLREHGYSVEIYDGTFADSTERILSRLDQKERPRVAGIFAMNSFRDLQGARHHRVRRRTGSLDLRRGVPPRRCRCGGARRG